MMKTYDERLFPIARMDTYAHYISDSTCNSVRERAGGGGSVGEIVQGHSTGYEERRCETCWTLPFCVIIGAGEKGAGGGGPLWTYCGIRQAMGIRAEMLSAFTRAIVGRARGRAAASRGRWIFGGGRRRGARYRTRPQHTTPCE